MVPEDLNLFERLTGAEMLAFTGRMYGLQKAKIAERAPELLELMDLQNEPKKLIVEYSHGMKRKLSLACALIHRPEVLFLDGDAIASQLLDRFCQVNRIPENNSRDHQVESTGPVLLIFVGSIADLSQLIVADRTR